MIRNVAGQTIGSQMIDTSGAAFGGVVSVFVTGDNGAQAAAVNNGGNATAKGNGLYTYPPSQGETNYTFVEYTFISPGAVPQTVHVYTQYPQSGDGYPVVLAMATIVAAINAKTANLPADPASQAAVLTAIAALNNLTPAQVLTQINTALNTAVDGTVPADGALPSLRQASYMTNQFLIERVVSGTQVIIRKPDGTTTLFTCAVNNATQPTSITRSS